MMLDWQTLLVTLFILAASLYVARRGLTRLRSFRAGKRAGAPACEAGCGCSGTVKQAGAMKQKAFTAIESVRPVNHRQAR